MRYLTLLLLVAACNAPVAPDANIRAYAPLPIYTAWWAQVEACSGRSGDLHRVAFFAVKPINDSTPLFWGGSAAGPSLLTAEWIAPHKIYVVDSTRNLADVGFPGGGTTMYGLVGHEMLHDLLGGDPHHLDPAWLACFHYSPTSGGTFDYPMN